jgi:hypothetical protein
LGCVWEFRSSRKEAIPIGIFVGVWLYLLLIGIWNQSIIWPVEFLLLLRSRFVGCSRLLVSRNSPLRLKSIV